MISNQNKIINHQMKYVANFNNKDIFWIYMMYWKESSLCLNCGRQTTFYMSVISLLETGPMGHKLQNVFWNIPLKSIFEIIINKTYFVQSFLQQSDVLATHTIIVHENFKKHSMVYSFSWNIKKLSRIVRRFSGLLSRGQSGYNYLQNV